jgi:tight adherence protein B
MLLNSYEGFDYMDYSRYSMSTKDWGIVFIKSMAATVIIAYLFYDSPPILCGHGISAVIHIIKPFITVQ